MRTTAGSLWSERPGRPPRPRVLGAIARAERHGMSSRFPQDPTRG